MKTALIYTGVFLAGAVIALAVAKIIMGSRQNAGQSPAPAAGVAAGSASTNANVAGTIVTPQVQQPR